MPADTGAYYREPVLGEGGLLASQGGQRKLLNPNPSFYSVSLSVPDMYRGAMLADCRRDSGVGVEGREPGRRFRH
jgi:hypothetical protein